MFHILSTPCTGDVKVQPLCVYRTVNDTKMWILKHPNEYKFQIRFSFPKSPLQTEHQRCVKCEEDRVCSESNVFCFPALPVVLALQCFQTQSLSSSRNVKICFLKSSVIYLFSPLFHLVLLSFVKVLVARVPDEMFLSELIVVLVKCHVNG